MTKRRDFLKGLLGGAATVAAVSVPAPVGTKTPYSFPREEIEYGETITDLPLERDSEYVRQGWLAPETFAREHLGVGDELKRIYNETLLENARNNLAFTRACATAFFHVH